MRELAADGIPFVVSCRVLKLSRQPYYRWLKSPVRERELVQAYRANALHDAHLEDPEFGHRFLADEARWAGEGMCDRTCLLYTSDAADDLLCVDLGGRRNIKKKKIQQLCKDASSTK